MNAIQKTICASLVLAGVASGGASRAADVTREFAVGINEANAKVQAGDVEGALKQYSEVRTLQPESADLSYNMAVAQYLKGDVAAAEPLFQAAATSENDSLAAKARYNLGNCDYAAGVELSQKDRPAAIEQLESAISNYRSSLEVDTNNADARANIELAAQLIEKLREEQKQQEQQQNKQQQDEQQQNQENQQQNQDQQSQDQQQNSQQQNQDQKQSDQQQQNQENKDQQQDSQSQSSQGGEQQEKQQEDKQENQSESQQSQDEKQQQGQEQEPKHNDSQSQSDEQQRQDQQKEQEQSQKSEQQKESKDSAQQQPQNQQSQSSQQRDQQQTKQQQPQPNQDASASEEAEEKPGQKPPQGELTTVGEEEAKQNQDQKPIAAFDPAKDGEMTQQEAEKMLQAIRDRDMLRRYRRQQEQLQQHVPVDKDW